MKLTTDWRVHPGEMLQEALDERGMSQSYLAWATGYTPKHINQICKGHVAISAPVAVALEAELEITAEFWLSVQMHYDLHLAREQAAAASDAPTASSAARSGENGPHGRKVEGSGP